jgi:hypothetical protein
VTGTWEMADGVLDGQNAAGDALMLAPARMTDGRIVARWAAQTWDDWENAAIIFDHQDRTHFKFVRMRAGDDLWCIGERTDEWLTHLATYTTTIEDEQFYDVEALFRDGEVRLLIDGEYVLSYDWGLPFEYDQVGLYWRQAHTHVDWWQTTAMSPTTGASVDFAANAAGWQVITEMWHAISGVYSGAQADAQALSMVGGHHTV